MTAWGQSRERSHFSDGSTGVPSPALVSWCSFLCVEMGFFGMVVPLVAPGVARVENYLGSPTCFCLCISPYLCADMDHITEESSLAISLLSTDFSNMPER